MKEGLAMQIPSEGKDCKGCPCGKDIFIMGNYFNGYYCNLYKEHTDDRLPICIQERPQIVRGGQGR